MIINNLRWYNKKSEVLIFPSYFNNCQSSWFYHHILWQFATFWSNTITVLVNKLSKTKKNKANLRDLIAATGLVILLKLDSNHRFFSLCDLDIWWMTSKNNRAPLLYYIKLSASNWSYSPGLFKSGQNRQFFLPHDLGIWWMTLKNNRAPPLCYVKLCASFQSDRWIQTWFIIRKHSIWVKVSDLLSRVTLKFDGWPWKTTGRLFYTASSFLHHFKAIGEFKLELKSRNAQFAIRVKIGHFLSRVTLKYDRWPSKTIGHLFYVVSS